jgi:hypothetical protein
MVRTTGDLGDLRAAVEVRGRSDMLLRTRAHTVAESLRALTDKENRHGG